ncbi:GNAT family N-acetyltransferase [Treponema sp. OMZ 799]|uniref:GNAT family N-acetyltransferase n=1 Tax=Treponema sp. OMZ 799 TaxID=2563668 RepID=UPI0020A38DB5|nr:GNAT family protein [Treponema sp. OMZ 799]UTC78165.1 GNAT family N-acetyltransferase [Treponema sp. OMZ 799]
MKGVHFNMVIASSEKCNLVSREKDDFEWYWYWLNNGDWRNTDAPWEITHPNEKEEIRELFLKSIDEERNGIKSRVWIESNNTRIGSLNAYGFKKETKSIKIGIGIYESQYRGLGIAQSALKLWMKYFFENLDITRLELETYDFNKPMIRVAEKIGLKLDKVEMNIREWNDLMVDKYYFSINKNEYK